MVATLQKRSGIGEVAKDPSRLVLGTVQLGLSYGRRSGEPVLDVRTTDRILDVAWELGIRAFDTADAYGDAPDRLAGWIGRRGHAADASVVTKIGAADAGDPALLDMAAGRFDGVAAVTLLSHGVMGKGDFEHLRTFALSRNFEPGQSVYTAPEVDEAARAGAARIQAPLNVLDRRQIEAARMAGIAFDGRSIYLQGLLLDAPEAAEQRVAGGAQMAMAVQSAARQAGLSPAVALCAAALAGLGPGDRIVIGVDAPEQLTDLAAATQASDAAVESFVTQLAASTRTFERTEQLLDPRTWPRK